MKNKRSFTEELSPRQVLEIDACTQCGECLKHCPVQDVTGNAAVSPPEKIRMFREFIRSTDGLKATLFGPREVDRKLLEDFTKAVYECTTCGACGQNCPVGIFTQRLWPMLRKEMVKRGLGPARRAGEHAEGHQDIPAIPTTNRPPTATSPGSRKTCRSRTVRTSPTTPAAPAPTRRSPWSGAMCSS